MWLRFLGVQDALDLILRLVVNKTEVLFDMAWPLELVVAE